MTYRTALIATTITTCVVITACSDVTAPKSLVAGVSPPAAVLAQSSGPATVVATINGGGTAEMQPPLAAGTTTFGTGVKLLSDGTATGRFDCVDHHGDLPGSRTRLA